MDMPFFMENEEWYYFDFKEKKYKLTEKAPESAKKDYEDYYKQLNNIQNYHGK